jgi:predicted Zn-dependent protease
MSGLVHLSGLLAALAGEDANAEENLRSAVASEPDNELRARHLAVFLAERGRLQEGAKVLNEARRHVEKKDELERMRARMAAEATDS